MHDMESQVLEGSDSQDELRNSSTNTDSNRVLITKRAILNALQALMEEEEFSKISVNDILERAGVSRTTFYRSFRDKYDVMNWSYIRFKEINPQYESEYHSFRSALVVQLTYMKDNKRFFIQGMRYIGQNALLGAMYDINLDYMRQCWREAYGNDPQDYPTNALMEFNAAGVTKVIENWVLGGCIETPETVTDTICSIIAPEIMEVLY